MIELVDKATESIIITVITMYKKIDKRYIKLCSDMERETEKVFEEIIAIFSPKSDNHKPYVQ